MTILSLNSLKRLEVNNRSSYYLSLMHYLCELIYQLFSFTIYLDGVFAVPADLSAECQDIIRSMLVVDPLKRITIAEIR
jgi:hypothetical protein